MEDKKTPVLYVLMRTDLSSMNPGKGMAQCNHAGTAFIHRMHFHKDSNEETETFVNEWMNETDQGFGTVLTLGVTEVQMRTAVKVAGIVGLYAEVVTDPSYPIQVPLELGRALRKEQVPLEDINMKAVDVGEGDRYVTIMEDTCAWVFAPDKDDTLTKAVLGNFKLHP